MGPLIGFGGVCVQDEHLRELETGLNMLCSRYGFPEGECFKWSPPRDLWMHSGLVEEARKTFLTDALQLSQTLGVRAMVVIEDRNRNTATGATDHVTDIITLLLERFHHYLTESQDIGLVVCSQPTGGRKDEKAFLADCLKKLRTGTEYVKHNRIALNVLSCPQEFLRVLQLADIVVSCSVARVSGEKTYSPPVFAEVVPMLRTELGRKGGVGLKIHPDILYLNLYHWLLGDTHFWRYGTGCPLPFPGYLYAASEWEA
jgi:hypothetical protein